MYRGIFYDPKEDILILSFTTRSYYTVEILYTDGEDIGDFNYWEDHLKRSVFIDFL